MLGASFPFSIGFFAAWHNKESEFRAGLEEERQTGARIHAAFTFGQSLGISILGRYGCRWSSDQQYFTFWLCPSLEALEATMDRLESAGDFKFADSLHLIGRLLSDSAPEKLPATQPFGMITFWLRRTASVSAQTSTVTASAQAVQGRYAARGVWSPGLFESHWSSHWAYFAHWTANDLVALEDLLDELELEATRAGYELRHMIGQHAPQFRFGTHLHPPDGA